MWSKLDDHPATDTLTRSLAAPSAPCLKWNGSPVVTTGPGPFEPFEWAGTLPKNAPEMVKWS